MLEEYDWILQRSPLFLGADTQGLRHILGCLEAYVGSFGRGEMIYHYGDLLPFAGLVLEGKVELVVPGSNGEESVIRTVGVADSFGCSQSCIPGQTALTTVIARKKTKVLFLRLAKLFRPEAIGCRYASLVTANLLRETAAASLEQDRRIHVMSQRSIRDKLLMFLEQREENGAWIALTMNRQELADYLGVERSALSREMSRMKAEGVIDYRKNEILMRNLA